VKRKTNLFILSEAKNKLVYFEPAQGGRETNLFILSEAKNKLVYAQGNDCHYFDYYHYSHRGVFNCIVLANNATSKISNGQYVFFSFLDLLPRVE